MKVNINILARLVVAIAFLSFVVWIHISGIGKIITLEALQQKSAALTDFTKEHYLLSVLGFTAIYALAVALSMPAAFLITVAGGFLYGTFLGTLFSVLGATVGAVFAFWIVRYGMGTLIQERFAKQLAAFNRSVDQYGTPFLVAIHFIAVIPFFLVNILAGVTTLSTWRFAWTTAVGIFPVSLVYGFAGSKLRTITSLQDLFSWPILIALGLIAAVSLVPLMLMYWFPSIRFFKKS